MLDGTFAELDFHQMADLRVYTLVLLNDTHARYFRAKKCVEIIQRGKADVDDHLDRDNCDGAWIFGFGHTAERRCHVLELVAGGVALNSPTGRRSP